MGSEGRPTLRRAGDRGVSCVGGGGAAGTGGGAAAELI